MARKVGGGHACTREPRKAWDGGVLVCIGVGSTSAVMGALAFGFTLGLVVKYGLADAGPRRVPARLSDLETASSTSFDLQRPFRVAGAEHFGHALGEPRNVGSPPPSLDITTTVAGSPSVGGTRTRWNGS